MDDNKNKIINTSEESELKNKFENEDEFCLEKFKEILKIKEEQLEKWQKSLIEKETSLENEKIRLKQENAKLEERERNEEITLKAKLDAEKLDAKIKLDAEQDKIREEFIEEIDKKRIIFEKNRQKALDNLTKELSEIRENTIKEIDNIRKNQENELRKIREENDREFKTKLDEQNKELEKQHIEALKKLTDEIAERTYELKKLEKNLEKEKENLKLKNNHVETLEKEINLREEKLKEEMIEIEREKRRLKREKRNIEEEYDNIDNLVNDQIEDTINNLKSKISNKDEALRDLRKQLSEVERKNEIVKNFKDVYKEEPEILIENIKKIQEQNNELKEKVANSIDKIELDEMKDKYKREKYERELLIEENSRLLELKNNYPILENNFITLKNEHESFKVSYQSLEDCLKAKEQELIKVSQELIRLSTPEGVDENREKRIAAIAKGTLDSEKDKIGLGIGNDSRTMNKTEIEWLDSILENCENYGIKFNKRIMYAFHTALKINDWSTITVLAGVSGTGKSELPRLYSEFGGLNFCPVAVQPNWDSQESMLGFFNSIDNRFEPEELLKFLYQCTESEDYKDYMSLILLDEMNLAHIEHYFAEFLSKLELRRGLERNLVPEVEVKLGAGVEPYKLKLSRTLLWTGTMNQDETTKSLSDKVLDRGIVINFPRPKKLERRSKMGIITEYIGENRPKLHKKTWSSWTTHRIEFSDEQIKKINEYKSLVEEINEHLEKVGRALGHRVWQSIEFYIANYPTVRELMKKGEGKNGELTEELESAMNIAFEDQIVQKIMPKLRGIETRDKSGKSCLEGIGNLLKSEFENLTEDFQNAKEQGYGQFIWNSAKYLEKDEI